MAEQIKCDLLVIGAGSGGLSVAAGASQMGADVVLLEGHEMGGDCLNYGCVPSKALIASARLAQSMRKTEPFGITPVEPQVNYAAVQDHVADVIAQISPVDSQERFEGFGVRVIRAFGRFVGPREVEAGDYRITARRIVIATGSAPMVPPIPGLADVPYLTNETLWSLRDQPAHLVVLGGGPIGLEMAQAHRRLGSEVTVIEAATLLNRDDPELAGMVTDRLRAEGIAIHEGQRAIEITGEAGAITVTTEDGTQVTGSHLLVALGRQPNLDRLNLSAAGIAHTAQGITVDRGLKTSNRKVYAIGDVAGQGQFTHLAGYHATIIIRNAVLGLPAKTRTDHIPRATYTDPEIGQVGLTEAEARATHGGKLEIARFDIGHNDRAIADRRAAGLVKVMVVGGRPVGVSIVGPQAGELINFWALVIANNMKLSQVSAMVSPYPTLTEVNKRAAGAYFTPRLFESEKVKRVVRFVQNWLP